MEGKKERSKPKYELINRKHCRDTALRLAHDMRNGWCPKQVSGRYLDELNTKVFNIIRKSVMSHRSVGVTIMDCP